MRPTRLLPGLLLTLSGLAATAQTVSKEGAVTLYGAYRDGGGFTDATNGNTLRLDGSSALVRTSADPLPPSPPIL